MKYASVTERLATPGGDKWAVHLVARAMNAGGANIIELTIGEPDVPTPDLMVAAIDGLAGQSGPVIIEVRAF